MWLERAARARSLAERFPASSEALRFYAALAEWQGQAAAAGSSPEDLLPGLRDLVERAGPPLLRRAARHLTQLPDLEAPPPLSFFARACRQPLTSPGSCDGPGLCEGKPQAGCLVTQAEGQALELVCALCFGRRSFPRGLCPACRETGRLAHYSAGGIDHLQVQACESCRRYLLVVDLARDPEALPEVDELAGLPLDLWARQQGYIKIYPNLAGI